jgi:sporulation protein YlmC with PRC-barrel domain
MPLVPITSICGAKVVDGNGEALGRIEEVMLDDESGRIAYVVLAHGGLAGVGEKLFALSFDLLGRDGDTLVSAVPRATFEARDGFDKDAWPTEADDSLSRA